MALIECPECQKRLSDQARICPHCGYPIKEITQKSVPGYINPWLGALGILLVIAAGGSFFWYQIQEYQKSEESRFRSSCDRAMAEYAFRGAERIQALEKEYGKKCIFTP